MAAPTKLEQIKAVIADARMYYDIGFHGLTDYHAAREVRDACRAKDKFVRIRTRLHSYNVMVSLTDAGVRIFRPDTQQEITL